MTAMRHPPHRISRTETPVRTHRGNRDKLLRPREKVRNVLIMHFELPLAWTCKEHCLVYKYIQANYFSFILQKLCLM